MCGPRSTGRWISAACLCICAMPLCAQTSLNPDLSVIPRFRMDANDGQKLPAVRQWSRPDFAFEELELALQAYLNPFAKADVILTLPGPDLEHAALGIEEVYATVVRGLPLDLNLRIGKYRAEFGKINMMHPHAWPFITQPLSQEKFFGEEGLNDLGVSASILLPTGEVYTKLTVDLLRGNSVGNAAGIPDSTGSAPYYANTARLTSFFTLSDYSDLETGLSIYTGIHDPYARERFWYYNADFKYKLRSSAYTSLVIQGEYLLNVRHAGQNRDLQPFLDAQGAPVDRSLTTSGLYIFADYQFFKIFSVGARYDWSETPYSSDDKATAVAIFAGYYPVEETLGVRMQYQHTMPQGVPPVNQVGLQVLFSLGPHKAHPF